MNCHLFAPARAVLAGVALLLTFGAGARPAQAQASRTIDVNAKIHVTVADEPDVTGDFTVDPTGDISMLYVNQVHVSGETPEQAAAAIRRQLVKYYRNPQVIVSILSPGGITVTVSGQVATQNTYTVRSDAHLDQVLLSANPSVDADLGNVQVTHGIPGDPNKVKQTVNFLSFRNANDPNGNPALHEGDVIYVPSKTAVPIQITFSGDFYKLGKQPIQAGTTMLDAVQQNGATTGANGVQAGGGPTATVNIKSYAIQRNGSRIPFDYQAARANPTDPAVDPVLQDGDSLVADSQAVTTNTYTITGSVGRPGPFPLTTPYITLSQALGIAGGTLPNARLKETSIIRTTPDGTQKAERVNAQDPQKQADTRVYPGDNVIVPQGSPGFKPDPLSILGAAGSLAGLAYLFRR